ncbi:MAG: helix-turn-helix transcriptional regulator [Capnocytophaga sp.]|nr:helix-turn-helix transcriptional regulator [Capnocytophaga sp.]
MYTISQLVGMGSSSARHEAWNGQIACLQVSKNDITVGFSVESAMFTFVLVVKGNLVVNYNGEEITLNRNDIHTYAPGMPTQALGVSEDYEAFCLMIDEALISQTPLMHHFVKAAYFPIAAFGNPKLTLTESQTNQLIDLLYVIRNHIAQSFNFQKEALLALCEVFSIDLLHFQNILVEKHRVSSRSELVFTEFLQLVSQHFIEHRDLSFYAEKLHISTTYLSRIVKQISGRTAMNFIEYSLITEAVRQLKTTDKSIAELAFDLNFADQASFAKFFTKERGISPGKFRKNEKS